MKSEDREVLVRKLLLPLLVFMESLVFPTELTLPLLGNGLEDK